MQAFELASAPDIVAAAAAGGNACWLPSLFLVLFCAYPSLSSSATQTSLLYTALVLNKIHYIEWGMSFSL
jgi:hypothetical protein